MVDFRKRLNKTEIIKEIDPIEIYEALDRRSVAGPLRPAQNKILTEWFTSRVDSKDLIIKLHTGEGKTLIGLLILQSKLNSDDGPCLYICPNKYLVQQVCDDAKKFGIRYCMIEPDNSFPNEFVNGAKILITHVQKVFNGKTIFGLGNDFMQIGSVILDDSHACIDSIKNSFTVTVPKTHNIYRELNELFKDDLSEQGHGTYLEIEDGDFNSFLPIPYWVWIDKSEEVIRILSNYREENEIAFAWPMIKDNIKNCQAFTSGQYIEITPIHIPIEKFPSFHKAKQRILMSATTQDDSFFIKGLGFDAISIKAPLNNPNQIWSGEKMIVIPSLIDESLDSNKIINLFAPPSEKKFGIVALVSSFRKTELYGLLGSLVPKSNQIIDYVNHMKKGNYKQTIVFANRYDGIDLPDENCRILILDGKPFFSSLTERYEENNRQESDLINIKIAQKIEQGLGRSVRGEKDYCLILLIGGDLIKFIKSSRTNKYFSPQTQKQIEIGIQIAEMATEDITEAKDAFEVIKLLMKQSLDRDDGWKEFYKMEMNTIIPDHLESNIYKVLSLERNAAVLNDSGNFEQACVLIQKIIDEKCQTDSEKGWYLQILARYKYLLSKTDSNNLQKSAFLRNNELLKPKEGITYNKLEFIDESRVRRMQNWLKNHESYEELILNVDGILSDLNFGINADKFEAALKDLGLMLGFLSERPDKEYKKGPDNLWCGVKNQYFIFECKNEVNIDRQEINKHEASQMNSHSAWFEKQYGDTAMVKRILIIPSKQLSYHADFSHDVEIMRRGTLKALRDNVKSFYKEFKKFDIGSVTDDSFQEFINTHKLDVETLKSNYSENYYHKTS